MRVGTFRSEDGEVFVGEIDGERVRRLGARSMLDWLAGEGREPAGDEREVGVLATLAPIPEPPSVRDFYAYERHVAAGWRRRGAEVPEYWYEAPVEDGRLRIEARVTVNGTKVTRSDASQKHFAWPELVAHAARDTRLRPGDVLGSGTLAGGCLLELGPQDFGDGRGERWIDPGDVVALHSEGLGTLETPIEG